MSVLTIVLSNNKRYNKYNRFYLKISFTKGDTPICGVWQLYMSVNTVLGPISREDIGIATSHEHIFIDLTAFYEDRVIDGIADSRTEPVRMMHLGILNRDPYAFRDNLIIDDFQMQKRELMRFKNAGGRTVFDATTIGINRDPKKLQKMARETGLNIVCGAGYYVGSTHSEEVRNMPAEELAKLIAAEVTEGMDGTDIKAGFIGEIGISELMSESEKKVLRAASLAQLETGAGLMIHINPWTENGRGAADIALETGVKPEKIAICHIDVEDRLDYVMSLLERGVYVEFDNFGKEYYVRREVRNAGYGLFVTDTQRVEFMKQLIDAGYLNRILLSNDVCLKTCLVEYGGYGYAHFLSNIVPMMEDAGITKEQINTMLVDNPADFFDVK